MNSNQKNLCSLRHQNLRKALDFMWKSLRHFLLTKCRYISLRFFSYFLNAVYVAVRLIKILEFEQKKMIRGVWFLLN